MTVAEILASVFLLSGALLSAFGALGLVRMPDVGGRLQAATKLQVPGLLLILAGVGVLLAGSAEVYQLVIVALFQLVTAPVIAQLVGRASYRSGDIRADLMVVDDLKQHRVTGRGEASPEEESD
ncbi:monovalent cation/H(+) antiporter subunit G [Phytoactinopolyspora halotolerans]|uniref:Na+/H+ antiporter subunit G n=1 Tax=Phytoactinopolyspora halotolerans TaxID=1981512 RepID=A0A6L9SBJ5_9ACTN|nr:monovalent cation/H(+) antiporter subunit G [Phytoactinopolyspora halotolerans]NEE02014.1 Na+/H+ antiporter subunit G [Phytoactinopolyspora halotolerans]